MSPLQVLVGKDALFLIASFRCPICPKCMCKCLFACVSAFVQA